MGDADETYPLAGARRRSSTGSRPGDDLVIGSRFEGTIHGEAMPWLNRLRRQPDPHRDAQPPLRRQGLGRALRDARRPQGRARRRSTSTRRAWSSRRRWSSRRIRRGLTRERDPDRLLPARRRVEAQPLRRRLAPREVHAPLQPELAVLRARRCAAAARARRRCSRSRPARSTSSAGRGRSTRCSRFVAADRCIGAQIDPARRLRADVRRVRTRRARPAARAARRAAQARARARSSAACSSCSPVRRAVAIGVGVGARRLRRARRTSTRPRSAHARSALGIQVDLRRRSSSRLLTMPLRPSRRGATRASSGARRVSTGTSRSTSARTAATRRLLALVRRAASDVLDVGCSCGLPRAAARRSAGCTVVGLELDPDAAEVARDVCEDVLVGDVETMELPFEPGSFDVVLCGDLVEHLRDPDAFLARVRPLLRAGGRLVLTTPNVANWAMRLGAPRRPLALHGARDPRPHAHAPLHAQDARRDARARRLPRRRARPHRARARRRDADRRARRARGRAGCGRRSSRTSSSSRPRRRDLRRHPRQGRRRRPRPLPRRRSPRQAGRRGGRGRRRRLGLDATAAPSARATPARVVHEIPPAEFGHGRTRNLGAELARGELLVFTSPGRVRGRRALARARSRLRRSGPERVAGAYGRQLPHDDATPARAVLPRLPLRAGAARPAARRRRGARPSRRRSSRTSTPRSRARSGARSRSRRPDR